MSPLNYDLDRGGPWWRCYGCGSDSSEVTYADVSAMYHTDEYHASMLARNDGDFEKLIEKLSTNTEWFRHYEHLSPNKTFLDIGCLDGSGMEAMRRKGWSVHGFDVSQKSYRGDHTTIAPVFSANLFPQQSEAVLCREVVEHVEGYRQFLDECYHVTAKGGLFQIQTPRPCPPGSENFDIAYQREHLLLFSAAALQNALVRNGFEMLDSHIWSGGQGYLLRKP